MRTIATNGVFALLAFLTLGFVVYAVGMGRDGLLSPDAADALGRLNSDSVAANTAISLHMLAGGAITVWAPLQAMPVLRNRWPALHRWSGYVIAPLAIVTALAGLVYMGRQGTIGGPWMTTGFTLYGLLMLWAAVNTLRYARNAAYDQHGRWALRLAVLAVGSWIYRVHYGIWYAATGGLASTPDFTGLFDRIQVFAFYLPYLLLLELWLRRSKASRPAPAGS